MEAVVNQVNQMKQKNKQVVIKPKKKRKKKSKIYFGTPVQDAIIEYNAIDSIEGAEERSRLYEKSIHAAFMKLAENLIHTFKFYYFDVPSVDVQKEVVSFLVLNIHKYQPDKGRAFSYFSIVAKNWLILNNNGNYKRYKITNRIEKTGDILTFKNNFKKTSYKPYYIQSHDEDEDFPGFIDGMVLFFEKKIPSLFKKRRDIMIADSVLELFRRKDILENFNKKALYLLVREMTGFDTQHITKVVNVLKRYYVKLLEEYSKTGTIKI